MTCCNEIVEKPIYNHQDPVAIVSSFEASADHGNYIERWLEQASKVLALDKVALYK